MTPGPVRISVSARSDLGRTRSHNEDTFLVADLSTGDADLSAAVRDHVEGPRGSFFLVADGMGGAAAGELASSMAAQRIVRHLLETWRRDPEPSPRRFVERMREAIELANAEVHRYAASHPEVRGMGTTVTAAGVLGDELYLLQIGDSRAYLVRAGEAVQLTKDQSLTQRLVDAGELTEEEAERSQRRNIILQALGPEDEVRVELTRQPLSRGDTLILCSDGLSGVVRREELAALAAQHPDPDALCGALIDLANERGGPDNVTVVVAHFEGEGLPAPGASPPAGYYPVDDALRELSPDAPLDEPVATATGPVPAFAAGAPEPAAPAPDPARRARRLRSTVLQVLAAIALSLLGWWVLR